MNDAIHCAGLVKIYKVEEVEVVALQGLDLSVRPAEMIGIVGPSGSGKTTLMNILGGLDVPSAGRALVAGRDLIRLSDQERLRYRRSTVGFVWQNTSRNLVPYLTAVENVELPMILSGKFSRHRAIQLLQLVGLGHRTHHRPRAMSTGEQQRVAVAIGLANEPKILLADEPTGSLDNANASQLLDLFDSVRHQLRVTVVLVTHDASVARRLDRFVAIRDGKTATESVRMEQAGSLEATNAEGEYEHFVLLDSAGRLQVPPELRERYAIGGRVQLIEDRGQLVIRAPERPEG